MIDEILEAEEGEKKVMGDVLRTLYLFAGTLWFPELYSEYVGFVRTLGEEPVDTKVLERAVKQLSESGLVDVRPGIRATASPEGEETYLVSLQKSALLRQKLSADNRVRKYMNEWKKYLGKY